MDTLVRTNGDSHKKNKSERLSAPQRARCPESRELVGMETRFAFILLKGLSGLKLGRNV